MNEALLFKIIHVLDMITIDEILDPIVILIEQTDHLTDVIHVLDIVDIDHVLIQATTILQNTFLHINILQDQAVPDILETALILTQELTSIQYKLNQ